MLLTGILPLHASKHCVSQWPEAITSAIGGERHCALPASHATSARVALTDSATLPAPFHGQATQTRLSLAHAYGLHAVEAVSEDAAQRSLFLATYRAHTQCRLQGLMYIVLMCVGA